MVAPHFTIKPLNVSDLGFLICDFYSFSCIIITICNHCNGSNSNERAIDELRYLTVNYSLNY